MAKVRMLLDNWMYKDYIDFVRSFSNSETETSYRLAQKLIGSWDYDADLNDPDAFLDLSVEDSTNVVHTVLEQVQLLSEDIDHSGITVDMSKWTTRRFLDFDKARVAGNMRLVNKMMAEVVTVEGEPFPEEPLFVLGAQAMAAILAAYTKMISGKN